jgi:hypothetical protein
LSVRYLLAAMAAKKPLGEVPAGLCSYSKKFPKYKRTGNLHNDCEGEAFRVVAMTVVDELMKDLSLAGPMKSWLEGRKAQQSKASELKSGRWHETYCYLEKLSKDWCAEFLVMIAKNENTHLDSSLLNAIDHHDLTNLKKIFHLVTFTTPSTKLPRECLDKAVCSMVFQVRCKEVGDRVKLLGTAVSSTGIVDWKKLGVYSLTFNDKNLCVSITHISGTTATLPDHIIIDTSYTLLSNDNDMTAMVKKGVAEYKLCELFDPAGQPWTMALDKKASQLRKLAVDEAIKLEFAKSTMESRVGWREQAIG